MPEIFSIGHSDKDFRTFVKMLSAYRIDMLVDVRTFPSSKKFPHFNKDYFEYTLPLMGIDYIHMPELGGFRKKHPKSTGNNAAWRLPAFRNYADYAYHDPAFAHAIELLKSYATDNKVAYMCSEAVPWSCHRGIVSDYMEAIHKWKVTHIISPTKTLDNKLHEHAIIENEKLIYPNTIGNCNDCSNSIWP
jgi:uncharacterized protein (DUF488 family)